MNSLIEPLRNQFLGLFFKLCCFLFLIPNLLFFYYLIYFHYPLLPSFFLFFFLSVLSLLISFLLPSFSLPLFVSAILTFPTSVSTAFDTSLDTLSSLLLLFSSQFQNCSKQAIAFSKSHYTFVSQSHWSLSSPYTLGNKYSPPSYIQ